MNQVTLIGKVLEPPELNPSGGGFKLCEFTLTVPQERSKNKSDVVHISVWRAKADAAVRYLKTGTRVMVTGKVVSNEYQYKSGKLRYNSQIIAKSVMTVAGLNYLEQSPEEGEE